MPIIHISLTIDYLFDADKTSTLCGRQVSEVLHAGEFIGLRNNLNMVTCSLCPDCDKAQKELA